MHVLISPWYFPLRYIKIPPSLLSIPSSLSPSAPPSSLSLVSRSPPRSHKLVLASSKWLRVHWRKRGEGSGPASISHFRAEELGDDRQPLSWTLTGLTAGTHPSSLNPTTLRLQHELLVGQPSQQTPALWVTLPTSKHFPGTHLQNQRYSHKFAPLTQFVFLDLGQDIIEEEIILLMWLREVQHTHTHRLNL